MSGWTYSKNGVPCCPKCQQSDMLAGIDGAYMCNRCHIDAGDYVDSLRNRSHEMDKASDSRREQLRRHHCQYIDSKSFLVDAEDWDRHFIAWRNPDGTIISVEILPGNWPWITVCTETDMKTWVESIAWHEWIKEGIQDDKLKALVGAIPADPEEEVI